jgi:hypothetical protein
MMSMNVRHPKRCQALGHGGAHNGVGERANTPEQMGFPLVKQRPYNLPELVTIRKQSAHGAQKFLVREWLEEMRFFPQS